MRPLVPGWYGGQHWAGDTGLLHLTCLQVLQENISSRYVVALLLCLVAMESWPYLFSDRIVFLFSGRQNSSRGSSNRSSLSRGAVAALAGGGNTSLSRGGSSSLNRGGGGRAVAAAVAGTVAVAVSSSRSRENSRDLDTQQ